VYMGGDVLSHEMLSGISTVGRGLRVKGEGEVLMWRSGGAYVEVGRCLCGGREVLAWGTEAGG